MEKIFLNDRAKVAVLDAVYAAEVNYVSAVRSNALKEVRGHLKEKHILREYRLRDIYKAQYRLCHALGLGDLYDDWRESPTYEDCEAEYYEHIDNKEEKQK